MLVYQGVNAKGEWCTHRGDIAWLPRIRKKTNHDQPTNPIIKHNLPLLKCKLAHSRVWSSRYSAGKMKCGMFFYTIQCCWITRLHHFTPFQKCKLDSWRGRNRWAGPGNLRCHTSPLTLVAASASFSIGQDSSWYIIPSLQKHAETIWNILQDAANAGFQHFPTKEWTVQEA